MPLAASASLKVAYTRGSESRVALPSRTEKVAPCVLGSGSSSYVPLGAIVALSDMG